MSQQLGNPPVGYTARTEARRVRGTEVVNPEIRNPRFAQCGAPNLRFRRVEEITRNAPHGNEIKGGLYYPANYLVSRPRLITTWALVRAVHCPTRSIAIR